MLGGCQGEWCEYWECSVSATGSVVGVLGVRENGVSTGSVVGVLGV